MADDMPPLDPMGNATGGLVDVGQAPPAPVKKPSGDNFFSQFVTGDEKPYSEIGFSQRFSDTAEANWYTGTGLGSSVARMQADPAAATERALDGLTEEEKQSARSTFADWQAGELAKLKTAENPVNVSDAQAAVIQNKLHPSAGGASDVAADVLGALTGGLASPEMLVMPGSNAAKGLAAAAPVTARFLEGMAGRMLDTGVSMAVLNTGMNPVIQKQSTDAGLQPGFDPMRLALAPLEGFVGGAVLHGGMELAGKGIGYATSEVRRGFQQQIWSRITDPLKEDAAFRAPGERAPLVDPEKMGAAPAKPNSVAEQPNSVSGADIPGSSAPPADAVRLGSAEPQARLASQPAPGPQSVTARMSADAIKSDLGVEVPGTLIRGGAFGVPEQEGITAFHGTPHDFERFDSSKIGTGEGAQAYGHGLYFAESKGVAASYRDALAKGEMTFADGSPIGLTDPFAEIRSAGEKAGASWREAGDLTQQALTALRDGDSLSDFAAFVKKSDYSPELKAQWAAVLDAAGKFKWKQGQGSLYQVRIKADPAHFLDWDGLADHQPKAVMDALEKTDWWPYVKDRIEDRGHAHGSNPTGQHIWKDLLEDYSPEEATQLLHEAGIQGIRYADAGSRAKGEGTSNFVVFDDSKVNIVSKNGKVAGLNETLRGEAKAKFGEELKAAGVKPKDLKALDARADELAATNGHDYPAAYEAAAIEREAKDPRVAEALKESYGDEVLSGPASGAREGAGGDGVARDGQIRQEGLAGTGDGVRSARADGEASRVGNTEQLGPDSGRASGDVAPVSTPELAFRKRTGQSPEQPATAGTGEPPVDAIKSLQQQTFALAEALGVPFRQGRLAAGDALGQFNSKYGVARVRDVGDFFVAAHEGGHALEQKIGPEMTALIDKFKLELGPLDYGGQGRASEGFAEWFAMSLTNPAKAQKEAPSFAQEFRAYLGGKDPETLAKLDEAAQSYANYLAAPSGLRVASNVVQKGETGWYGETKEFLKKEGFPATIGKVLADAYGAFFDDKAPVTRTVRDLARLFRENHKGDLLDLKAADNPDTLLRLFGRAQQGAIYQMRYGVVPYRDVTPVGASLHDAIATATGASPILGRWQGASVDDFSTYMVAKRASVLWDRFTAGDLEHPPVAFSKADAEATLAELVKANPGFEKGSQMVHEYTRNMLAKQRDAGLITQDLFDTLAKDPFYVPLFRDVEDKPLAGKTGGGGSSDGPGMIDTIKRLRGSSRDIIDPLQGIMMQTFLAERTIRHNDIIKAFADLAGKVGPGAGAYVEPVAAKELRGSAFDLGEAIKSTARQRGLDPNDTALLMNSVTNAFGDDPIMGTMFKMQPASKKGEPIMFYKEAGELKAVRFMAGKEGEAVYEALSSLPDALKDLSLQLLQGAASTLRFGVTANPTFIATNFIRDQMALGILRKDYIPFVSGARGILEEINQSKAAQLYAYFGGVAPGAAITDTRGMMDANVGSIAAKGYLPARFNLSSPKEFMHGLVDLMQITESATRNSVFAKVYEQKISQGLSPYEAGIEAAYQGTDILDFGRHGSRTMAIRQLIPFLNAHLQGLDLGRRTLLPGLARVVKGEGPLTDVEKLAINRGFFAIMKFGPIGAALGFAYAALNWDREEYRDANNDMKATHLVIPWGHKVLTIPKPFELSLGFNAGEAAYAAMMGKDPRAAANFTEGAWEVLKPPNPITGNPLIKTVFEVALNRNMFTGRDIVPQSLQAIDSQHEFTEKTSMFARKVGDITNGISGFLKDHTNPEIAKIMGFSDAWSPIKVDYAIGSLFGMWGKDIQAASNWFAGDDDKPESQFEDMVFMRRFLKDPNRSGEMTKRYFEFAAQKTGQYAQAANTYDRYTNMYQDQKAKDWLATLPDDRKAFVTLNAGADDESGKRKFSADDRRIHPVTRAQAAMSQLNSITRELTFNSQINTETGERYQLTPTQRRDAIEAVHQLGAQEMRNALVMVGDKGYEGRPILDTGKQYEIVKAISPEVGEEVARRYATGKVLPAASVAEVWPQARKRLLQDGSEADISDLTADANAAGYEFGGERTKRREKRRGSIKGKPQPEAVE